MKKIYLAALSFLCACNAPSTAYRQPETTLYLTLNGVALHEAAGTNEKITATLGRNDSVQFLGKISAFTSRLVLANIPYEEPWLLVRTTAGKTGWLFGGTVRFAAAQNPTLAQQLYLPRMMQFFGKSLTEKIKKHNQHFDNADTQAELLAVYTGAHGLRDSLQEALHRRIMPDPMGMPDMFWLKGMVHGLVLQLSPNKTQYALFFDYGAWQKRSYSTKGEADDDFMKLCRQIYPDDGIEYTYKCWTMPTDETEKQLNSLLGEGQHLAVLQSCNAALSRSTLFRSEILAFKAALLDDMIETTNYWQTQDKILHELDAIIAADLPAVLSQQDRIALKMRREQLTRPAQNHLVFNKRAGNKNGG